MPFQPVGVIYPDLEQVGTDYLRTALAGRPESFAQDVFVSNKVPNPRRSRMVIVRRDGGAEGEFRDNGRLSVRVWAATDADATDLAALVNALLSLAADGSPVLRARRLSGPLPVSDDSEQALRFSVFDIDTRGTEVT